MPAGVYRWAVKTLSDPAAVALKGQVPTPTTIADLIALPAPTVTEFLPRQEGAESTLWTISGTLVAYKPEADQDYHLVVHDDAGHSMIVEIPDPTILEASCQFPDQIKAARAAFDARFGAQMAKLQAATTLMGAEAPVMITNVNQPVRVIGIGYYDEIHGQTGVAVNGIELHPVIQIEFTEPAPTS